MYIQTLYKVLKNHIKPKVLSRMNRYNKWEYGYNQDHDMIVISKTGQIGEVYEIQNLKIALPKAQEVHEFKEKKQYSTGESIQKNLKKNITTILIMSLKDVKKVFGIKIKIFLLTSLVLTTCIYNGRRLT
jgi:hypothetical protein